jgi:glutamyl-tRNA synthetase
MNEYYIKNIDESELYKNFVEYCEIYKEKINPEKEVKIKLSLSFLKNKAKTLEDIYNNAKYIISDEIIFKNDDLKLIDEKAKKIIKDFKYNLSKIDNLNRENLEPVVNILIKNYETNFKGVGQPLRVALTGSKFGPGLYDIVISLGKEEVKKRLESKILI